MDTGGIQDENKGGGASNSIVMSCKSPLFTVEVGGPCMDGCAGDDATRVLSRHVDLPRTEWQAHNIGHAAVAWLHIRSGSCIATLLLSQVAALIFSLGQITDLGSCTACRRAVKTTQRLAFRDVSICKALNLFIRPSG